MGYLRNPVHSKVKSAFKHVIRQLFNHAGQVIWELGLTGYHPFPLMPAGMHILADVNKWQV